MELQLWRVAHGRKDLMQHAEKSMCEWCSLRPNLSQESLINLRCWQMIQGLTALYCSSAACLLGHKLILGYEGEKGSVKTLHRWLGSKDVAGACFLNHIEGGKAEVGLNSAGDLASLD